MIRFVLLVLVALTLIACGKKPGSVSPPPGSDAGGFPGAYPPPQDEPPGPQAQP